MRTSASFGLTLLSAITLIPTAHAIKGTYLPEDQLSKSTCKIKVGNAISIYTPSYENGIANGMTPFRDEMKDVSMCSSTLIAPDTILTAAHCFVGNNEQTIKKGRFLYPKMDAKGNLIPGCDRETWAKNKNCIAGQVFGTYTMKWSDMSLECPTADGKVESRPLKEATGYPNPLFRADADPESVTFRNFDAALWRVETPFTNTPVMPVEYDWNKLIANLKRNANSCKSYGYGLDNDDKSGTLHGALTPITAATTRVLYSDLAPQDGGIIINGGRTDHGDSGGTLTCDDEDGIPKLYGIVSRGGEDIAPNSEFRTDISMYSMPAYNASWIQHVLKNGPVVRSLDKQWWYNFTVGYHQSVLEQLLSDTYSCIQENRRNMSRDVYKNAYLGAYNDIRSKYSAYKKEASGYADGAGLLRSHMKELVDLSNRLLMDCQAHHF